MVLRMISSNYAKKEQGLSGYTVCLSGFRANLASHIARSSLNHSYGYASADDRTICFATFTLKPDPSCNMRARIQEAFKITLQISSLAVFTVLFLLCASFYVNAESIEPLPPLPAFSENPLTPEKVELGKKLFFDRRLSGDGTMACATCHNPETGYTDALAISLSYPTTRNWRNAPAIINLAYNKVFFWDGRAENLEKQSLFPIMSAFEMNQNIDFLEEELKEVPEYVKSFQEVFGGVINRERIGMALAAFQKTIISKDSPLDKYLAGDKKALTAAQKDGYDVFTGKGECIICHNGPNLTDNKFYNTGVPDNPEIMNDSRVAATRRFTAKVSGYKAYSTLKEDPGRYLVTKDRKDWKAFKTPSLRELSLTGPYMHNGTFSTVKEVIEFFDKGGGDDPDKTPLIRHLKLTDHEKNVLEIFLLEALKGDLEIVKPPEVP